MALSQCILCVQAEETLAYGSLIDPYYAFLSPSAVAATEDAVVVFDSGELVIFKGEEKTSFSVGAPYCYTLCAGESDIVLFVGSSAERSSSGVVKCFSYAGAMRELTITENNVKDIALAGDKLLVLFEYKEIRTMLGQEKEFTTPCVAYYDLRDLEAEKTHLILTNSNEWAKYIVTDGEDLYLRTEDGNIVKKNGETFDLVAKAPAHLSNTEKNFTVHEGVIYYYTSAGVFKGGSDASFIETGDGDRKITSASSVALSGELVYVADSAYRAIKVFHAESGEFRNYIGSCGKEIGRLTDPIALSVKGGRVAVVDANMRASLFAAGRVSALEGHRISAPTDLVLSSEGAYLVDQGVLYEYGASQTLEREYTFEEAARYVAAGSNDAVYVAAGSKIYVKRAGETAFSLLRAAGGVIDRLNIGIGGKVIYALVGNNVYAYTPNGDPLAGSPDPTQTVLDFAVDYRGNLYLLTSSREIVRYLRTVNGYYSPTSFFIGNDFSKYADISIDSDGTTYLLADHNVISFEKDVFGVVTGADSDFVRNETPSAESLFVCVVEASSTIAYVAPDNFEDVSYIARGTKLLCYDEVTYADNLYCRVETETGVAYVPAADVRAYESAPAPFERARCLHTKLGVSVYAYPSKIDLARDAEPLFSSLKKEEVFDVLSYVAVDEEGKDVWGFYRVRYQDIVGYVLISDVVTVDEEPVPIERYKMKIKAEKLGKMVVLYESASVESEEVTRLADGTEIDALEPLDEEKEFIQVLYDGKVCYVQPQYLGEGGLSAGQTLAIVLSVVAVTASIIVFLILRAGKKRKIVYKE
ncbi:MAG: hypothetical protein J6Y74_00435 [Clostridia bacterium]|nr:hypothetical protein [Clostridia bacterium]